ncbi:hypothetical protein Tco_1069398 [Tanacetum coccineum]|uniref:Reverse transcriptase domain-containing protein n=1 Tax=Tanacetum coccineum TaxID=301880 RepID=A0ABQ5HIL0_9ASTR
MPLSTYIKLTGERPAETDIRLSLASHSYIYPLRTAEDVLVDVAGFVYPVDFVILDIKEDEKRPFILGTPFLTTAKVEKVIKNNIRPIAPTMTINRLVLEWEKRIKLNQEKEMKFDQWRNKNFKNEHLALVKVENGLDDEGEVTKRISKKRTKNQAKNDKIEHGMEMRGKAKAKKSKPKSKTQPRGVAVNQAS